MVNVAAVLGSLSAIVHPSTLLPRLIVKDINQLNWQRLKAQGVHSVIIDKDNCITRPGIETLETSLESSWNDCLSTFGPQNVLIVSNSAGTRKDSLLLEAETLSRNLHVPVLIHSAPKPSPTCALSISHYFSPPAPPPPASRMRAWIDRRMKRHQELKGAVVWDTKNGDLEKFSETSLRERADDEDMTLLVIGDRITTDILLACRLNHHPLPSSFPSSSSTFLGNSAVTQPRPAGRIRTVSVLTTKLHARDSLGTIFFRSIENQILRMSKEKMILRNGDGTRWEDCLNIPSPARTVPSSGRLSYVSTLFRDACDIFASTAKSDQWSPAKKWNHLFDQAQNAMEVNVVDPVEKGLERIKEGDSLVKRIRSRNWI